MTATGRSDELLDQAGLPSSFCAMPWTHMMAKHTGKIRPCCFWSDDEGGADGFPLAVDGELDIDAVINGEEYRRLRRTFLSGGSPNGCASCHRAEAAGLPSHRTSRIEMYEPAELAGLRDSTDADGYLHGFRMHWFDFRMSNLCNLKCRMCFPTGSSRIAAEYAELGWPVNDVLDPGMVRQWFDQFISRIGDARLIYFAGGEPLMMDAHWRVLDTLSAEGNTSMALTYSTNLSQLAYKDRNVLDAWTAFDDVYLSLSIDHVGPAAEYIRHGLRWEEWVRNFGMLRERCPHVKWRVATTVTVLNVMDLPVIIEELLRLGVCGPGNGIDVIPVEHPEHLCVRSMPPALKDATRDVLLRWCAVAPDGLPDGVIPSIESVVGYMMSEDRWRSDGAGFLDITRRIDRHRREDAEDLFPMLVRGYEDAAHDDR